MAHCALTAPVANQMLEFMPKFKLNSCSRKDIKNTCPTDKPCIGEEKKTNNEHAWHWSTQRGGSYMSTRSWLPTAGIGEDYFPHLLSPSYFEVHDTEVLQEGVVMSN